MFHIYCSTFKKLKYFTFFSESHDSGNFYFCFRWILILFKREFHFHEIQRLWEVSLINIYSFGIIFLSPYKLWKWIGDNKMKPTDELTKSILELEERPHLLLNWWLVSLHSEHSHMCCAIDLRSAPWVLSRAPFAK